MTTRDDSSSSVSASSEKTSDWRAGRAAAAPQLSALQLRSLLYLAQQRRDRAMEHWEQDGTIVYWRDMVSVLDSLLFQVEEELRAGASPGASQQPEVEEKKEDS